MKIYETFANDGDYYNPIEQIGIFDNLEQAKMKAEKYAEENDILDIDIYVLELRQGEFVSIETWGKSCAFDDKDWERSDI